MCLLSCVHVSRTEIHPLFAFYTRLLTPPGRIGFVTAVAMFYFAVRCVEFGANDAADGPLGRLANPFREWAGRFDSVTGLLIWLNVAVFILQLVGGLFRTSIVEELLALSAAWPAARVHLAAVDLHVPARPRQHLPYHREHVCPLVLRARGGVFHRVASVHAAVSVRRIGGRGVVAGIQLAFERCRSSARRRRC